MLEERKQVELAESNAAETPHVRYLNSFKEGQVTTRDGTKRFK